MENPTPEQIPQVPVVPTPAPTPTPTPAPVPEAPKPVESTPVKAEVPAPVEVTNIPFYQPQAQPAQTTVEASPGVSGIKVDAPQVIEKIVYKKQRIHGFFRTLTIIALLVVGVLMLLENTGVMKLSINNVNLDLVYPIVIIFSTIIIRSYRGIFGKIFGLILFLGVVGGFFGVSTYSSLNPSTKSKFGNFVSYDSPAGTNSGIVLSQLNINTLIGNFDIKGLETKNLAEGTYKSDRNLLVTSGVKQNYDYLSLKEDPNWNLLQNYFSNLALGISQEKVINLYLKNLLGIHNVDLTKVKWSKVKIHGGVQDLNLMLGTPAFTNNEVEVQLVGGRISLTVPKDVGVKLYFKQWGGSLELTDFDIKGKDYFESKNIATAKKIININVSVGVSTFTLLRK